MTTRDDEIADIERRIEKAHKTLIGLGSGNAQVLLSEIRTLRDRLRELCEASSRREDRLASSWPTVALCCKCLGWCDHPVDDRGHYTCVEHYPRIDP